MSLVTFLQKSPMIVLAVIITFLAYQLALLTWSFVPEEKSTLQWQPVTGRNSDKKEEINTQNLQQQHLFGEKAKGEKVVAEQQDITDAPRTRLKLKLVGIVAASEPEYSSVIIEYKGTQDSYFIDSKIEGTGAEVNQIYPDRIILDVDGSLQTLMLDETDDVTKNKRSGSDNKRSSRRTKETAKTVNIDRQELLKNPGKLTDYIRISPVRKEGKVKGYRVKPGKDKTLFEEAGLKSGDLAVELNGIDLTDTQEAFTLMKEFPTMTDMTLTIERDGQLHELYFSIP